MSKKQQRISKLIGVLNSLSSPDRQEIIPNKSNDLVYKNQSIDIIKSELIEILRLDGIGIACGDSKVND